MSEISRSAKTNDSISKGRLKPPISPLFDTDRKINELFSPTALVSQVLSNGLSILAKARILECFSFRIQTKRQEFHQKFHSTNLSNIYYINLSNLCFFISQSSQFETVYLLANQNPSTQGGARVASGDESLDGEDLAAGGKRLKICLYLN